VKYKKILDQSIVPDLAYLRTVADGEVEIVSRTLDDNLWVVLYIVDDGPTRFYLYVRQQHVAHFLFTNRQALEKLPLVKMHSTVIKSRDGLNLVLYYSLPPGSDYNCDGIPTTPSQWCLLPTGVPGAVISGVTTPGTNGYLIGAMPSCVSTFAHPPASARRLQTPVTASGAEK